MYEVYLNEAKYKDALPGKEKKNGYVGVVMQEPSKD
jgi:hypothetical protein